MGLPRFDRRSLLKYASVSGLASLATACLSQNAPTTVTATGSPGVGAPAATSQAPQQQTYSLKLQSTWGSRDYLHEIFSDYVKKVDEMAGGQLKIDLLPAGAVVGAFDLIDAVHSGTLDGGHGVPAYWFGKDRAASLFGTGPSLGMDANMVLGWIHYGGGQELYNDLIQRKLKLNVVSFFHGPMPTQPLGWFDKEITSIDEFKGVKFRTVGMAIDVYKGMGANVIALPGAEVVPALERKVIDAAEYNNPSSDLALGFGDVRKVYMMGSYHQQTEFFEIMFNKAKFDSLPKHLQAILKWASVAQSADMSWKSMDKNSKDLATLKGKGVKVVRTPKSILDAQLKIWDDIIAKDEKENPDFAKIIKSQRDWAARVVDWYQTQAVEPPDATAYRHFFKK